MNETNLTAAPADHYVILATGPGGSSMPITRTAAVDLVCDLAPNVFRGIAAHHLVDDIINGVNTGIGAITLNDGGVPVITLTRYVR